MLKLLTFIVGGALNVNGIMPLVNHENISSLNQNQVKNEKEYFWNDGRTREEKTVIGIPKAPNWHTEEYAKNLFTIDLGKEKPINSILSFIGIKNVSATRWGTEFVAVKNWDKEIPIFIEEQNNIKIKSTSDYYFGKYASIKFMKGSHQYILSRMEYSVYYGYTWYQENGNYYMQFLLNQMVSMFSFAEVVNSVDIGAGFVLK
ncbi:hypothetical protein ESOMN_v1c05300 [Williamsoniiplasma somnilux]|uniref:Uncharacterized protein n=1 Tax=Williamsoniiplasma somnilux TaxID=215578 RepID=A0A2K8NYK5_9MOLU|nr:hypothetical protein [Williamsoniiplasma somnilux]ATZ18912.1 hypothetical protein ESOMN_v1c05300 [Williamsoniiplasma somnilux]